MTQEPVVYSFGSCTVAPPLLDGSEEIVSLIKPEHATAVAEIFARVTQRAADGAEDVEPAHLFDSNLVATCLPLLHGAPGLAKAVMGACLRNDQGERADVSLADTNDLAAFVSAVRANPQVFAGLKEVLGNALALVSA